MRKDEFLARVQQAGGLGSAGEAERWSVAVLTALSHLFPDPEIRRHFIAQLPGFLKNRLRHEPPRGLVMDREAFVQHVAAALGTHAPEAERALAAVYRALKAAVSPGQLAAVEAHLPGDLARFLDRVAA